MAYRSAPADDEPPRRGFFNRNLEYLVLAGLAVLAVLAVLGVARTNDDETATGAAATSTSATGTTTQVGQSATPTCVEAGITPFARKEGTCRTASALLTVVNGRHPLLLGSVRAQILSARALRASTPQGIRRGRARVVLQLRITNTGRDPLEVRGDEDPIYIAVDDRRVDADPNAQRLPGALRLDEPLRAGLHREGFLRFELEGQSGRRFLASRRAQLGVRPAALGVDSARERVGVARFLVARIEQADEAAGTTSGG